MKITITIDPTLWEEFRHTLEEYPEYSYSSWIQYQIAQFVRAKKEGKGRGTTNATTTA